MDFILTLVFFGSIYAIVVMGYALIAGLGKQFLISQAALWGMGAYAYGISSTVTDWPTWVCAVLGALAGALGGGLIAVTAMRVSGIYLAITSFAFQIVFVNVLQNLDITGGTNGLTNIRPGPQIGSLEPVESSALLSVLTALVVTLIYRNWHGGAFGLAVRALGEGPQVAEGFGLRPKLLQLKIITLSGLFAGIAGVLFAQYLSFVDPNSFDIHVSISLLSMLIVGGSRTVLGPIVGVLFYLLIPQVVSRFPINSAIAADLQQIIFALVLLGFLFWRPEGLVRLRQVALRAAAAPASSGSDAPSQSVSSTGRRRWLSWLTSSR